MRIRASVKARSPNSFFTANAPANITTTALDAMFQQSLVAAHITN
jgi:hypothetical protein